MRHLLIVAPNWLGDTIMAQPAMMCLYRHVQPAHVSLIGRPWLADLLTFMGLQKAEYAQAVPNDADAAVLFPNSFRAAWQIWRAGIPERTGFSGQWRSLLLSRACQPHIDMATGHHRDYFLDLVAQIGVPTPVREVRLSTSETEISAGQALMQAHGLDPARVICVAPGAQFGGAKRYPSGCYADALADLGEQGWQPVMLGSGAERDISGACLAGVSGKHWNTAGQTSLRQALQMLAACRLLLCNDSGLMHVAAGMGRPVVAIFGATDPARTAPSGKKARLLYHPADCSPCLKRECHVPGQPCMANVSPEEVADACLEALA